jgi:hypothetical protein
LAALASDFEAHMVQPYNYAVQAPSAFESLVSGLKLGTSLQEMQAQRQLREAQAEQIQQKMEADRARTLAMQEFRAKPFSELTQGDIAGLQGLLPPEAVKGIKDAFDSMRSDERRSRAGQLGEMASVALSGKPDAVDAWFAPRIDAEQDPARRKALETWRESAKINPQALAKTLVTQLSLSDEGREVAKNLIEMYGLKAKEPEKDPEDIRTMRLLGLSITPETYEKFKQAGQRPEAGSALQKAQAYRQTLIAQGKRDTPEFEENQRYINNLLVDPSAQTAAQIEANRLAQARFDQMERINSPEYQAALAEAKARGTATGQAVASKEAEQRAAVSVLKSIGYNTETGEDDVSKAIAASTSGGAQADIAAIMRYFGGTTKGMQAIGKLQTVASRLTTEILGGRLGAGISNTDREFILQGLGDIGNPRLTASERLAGWTSARNRMVQVGILPAGRSAQPQQPAAPQGGAKPVTEMSNEEILRRLRGQ